MVINMGLFGCVLLAFFVASFGESESFARVFQSREEAFESGFQRMRARVSKNVAEKAARLGSAYTSHQRFVDDGNEV